MAVICHPLDLEICPIERGVKERRIYIERERERGW